MVVDLLTRTLKDRGEIVVIYNGGSQPGTRRRIQPIKIGQLDMRARDLSAQLVKSYRLDRIQIAPTDCAAAWYVPRCEDEVERIADTPLPELIEPHRSALERLSWVVDVDDRSVYLRARFKNGKPHRSAKAGLVLSEDDNSKRPWHVFGPGLASGRSFSILAKAFDLFLQQAREHPPEH